MSQSEESRQGSQAEAGVVAIKQRPPRDEAPREGARQMLLKAIETKVADCAEAHQQEVDEEGRWLVVRNGYLRERSLVTGVQTPRLKAPRVADRRVDERGRKFRFTSQILPPSLGRTKSVEELIPWLYLKGISTGDFSEALAACSGLPRMYGLPACSGLCQEASTRPITRLRGSSAFMPTDNYMSGLLPPTGCPLRKGTLRSTG